MSTKQTESYAYTLNVQSVTMKVKFSCRMKLESNGEILTGQVVANENGKFIFNQEVTLKDVSDQKELEIVSYLISDKGCKYTAGFVRLLKSELIKQQGEMLSLPLSKCLDSQAVCEIRVHHIVSSAKPAKRQGFERSGNTGSVRPNLNLSRNRDFQNDLSPQHLGLQSAKQNHGSKSDFQFPLHNIRVGAVWDERRSKEEIEPSFRLRSKSPMSYKKKQRPTSQFSALVPDFGLDQMNRDKLIEAEVYRDNYQKLKEKYKKEAQNAKNELSKRMALENNQNNYKLEIMRLKLRCEDLQKNLAQKLKKSKEYQAQLAIFQQKELDLDYFMEESANKEHTIQMLEENIRTLTRDNDDLKKLGRGRYDNDHDKLRQMRSELQASRQKYELRVAELQKELRHSKEQLFQKDNDIVIKEEWIQRERRLVQDLEKAAHTKLLEYERSLQAEKSQWKSQNEMLREKVNRLEGQKLKLLNDLSEEKSGHEKIKSYLVKIEYDKKVMNQESDSFKTELAELKTLKQKYYEISRENKTLLEQKNYLQRQSEKSLQNKQSSILDITKQYNDQIESQKKTCRDLQERLKSSLSKLLEIEASLEQKKSQSQKLKRNCQSLTKEINDLRESEKNYKKSTRIRQDEAAMLRNELQSFKIRYRSGDQTTRYEIQNLRQQNFKLQKDLDAESYKNLQLSDKNTALSTEVNTLRLRIQQSEDQILQNEKIHRDRINNLEETIQQKDKKLNQTNQTLAALRSSDKQAQSKTQRQQIQLIKLSEKVESLQKESQLSLEKLRSSEQNMREKVNEINRLQNERFSFDRKRDQQQDQLSNLRNDIGLLSVEKNKYEKMIEILNRDLSESKHENERSLKIISEKEKRQEDLREESKKLKEELLKNEMKNSAQKKQYDRFKETILQELNSSYNRIPNVLGIELKDSVRSIKKIQRPIDEESEGISHNEVVRKISEQNNEIKASMNKLIEKNRILQKEIQKQQYQNESLKQKSRTAEINFTKIIEGLEADLQRAYSEKQEAGAKNHQQMVILQQIIEQKELDIKDLALQVEELNFTINGLRLDIQSKNQHYSYKKSKHQSRINELQEKINFQNSLLEDYEKEKQENQNKQAHLLKDFEHQVEQSKKIERQLKQSLAEKSFVQESNQEGKKKRKQLLERISDLELKLGAQTQRGLKLQQLLNEEENKGKELVEFVSSLMKQKQNAIKSELEKSQLINNLERSLSESKERQEVLDEENRRLQKTIQEQKDLIRKNHSHMKDLELAQEQQKMKYLKISQKLTQALSQLSNTKQMLGKLQEGKATMIGKNNKQLTDLKNELQQWITANKKREEQKNKLIQYHQSILEEVQNKLSAALSQNQSLEEQLFTQKHQNSLKVDQIEDLIRQLQKSQSEVKRLSGELAKINEESKEKEQKMYELTGNIYNLEFKLKATEEQKMEQIEAVTEDWTCKYEAICQEYEQRIILVEKERDYFKGRLDEKEEQYRKVVAELRSAEMDEGKLKKALEQKAKRLEEDRLNMITSKNAELQKLAEENKSNFEALKEKEADLRRIQHELDIARNTIQKLENIKRETEEKIKSINKVYQGEIEQLKRKEAINRSSIENLDRIYWQVEREVKKISQTYSKKFLTAKESPQTLLGYIKKFEEEIMNSIESKLTSGVEASI